MRQSELDLYRQEGMSEYSQHLEKLMFQHPHNFRVDVMDGGDHYDICAEFPGIPKEDIHLEADNNTLTLSAKHDEQAEDGNHNYLRKERFYGSFSRQFDISHVEVDKITAKYNHGLLFVVMPKKVIDPGEKRKIVIE